MKNKINIRLVGIAILAIISTVIGITIIYYNLFQKQIRTDLSGSANLLLDTHYFELADGDVGNIDFAAERRMIRVTWVDQDGTVLYDNDATAKGMGNHLDRPEIQAAFVNGTGESVRKSDTMQKNTFYYAIRLKNDTVLRVATDAPSLWSVFVSVAPIVVCIILLIMIACVGISQMLTKQLIRPIEIMAENLENADYASPYKELDPLAQMLRTQHTDVLSAAKARQDFTANVSHELKTPLTAISGYAEILESDMADPQQQKHFYQEIRKNANRLLALINDIIRLSELDRKDRDLHFEELNLYDLAVECKEELEMVAQQKGVTLSLEGGACNVQGNKDMLKELIENLVHNGIRYNNPDGSVMVSVQTIEGRSTLIVKDTGIGIPVAEQQRIFERFYRVDKSRSKATGGTGLGLAIVKHIVELHDASIEVDSALGVGTTMKVIF